MVQGFITARVSRNHGRLAVIHLRHVLVAMGRRHGAFLFIIVR